MRVNALDAVPAVSVQSIIAYNSNSTQTIELQQPLIVVCYIILVRLDVNATTSASARCIWITPMAAMATLQTCWTIQQEVELLSIISVIKQIRRVKLLAIIDSSQGYSIALTNLCWVTWCGCLNRFPHKLQEQFLASVCLSLCFRKRISVTVRKSHESHLQHVARHVTMSTGYCAKTQQSPRKNKPL